jgi:hypothetical protein
VISDPWIDRSPRRQKQPRVLKSPADLLAFMRTRRALLRAEGRCINGPKIGTISQRGVEHGPVYRAGRCRRCWDIKTGKAGAS